MVFFFSNYAVFGLVFLLLALLYKYYLNYKKKFEGFPFINLLPYLIYCHVSGKITKDTPVNNVVLEKLVQSGKKYINEGFFMTFVSRPWLVIYSEEAIKFFAHENAATDKSSEYVLAEEVLGNGLNVSNGARWRVHRRLINPAFNLGMLKTKIALFNKHAQSLVKDLEKLVGKPSVDVLDALKYNVFNALCESAMGLEDAGENKEKILKIAESVDDITVMTVKRFFYPWLRPKFVLNLLPSGRKFLQQNKECIDFVNEIISDMKKNISSTGDESGEQFGTHLPKSFAYILLNHHLNDPTFTYDDLHGEVKTILASGYHSTSYATMWCLYLLGLHPEIQEKVFDEIQSAVSKYVTYEECCNLPYLDAVIQESLRVYTTVPLFTRNLSEDVQFGNHKVSKGTTIVFLTALSHKNPKVYPDPDQFRPERFLNGEVKRVASFIPFSEGNRNCIGKHYALLEMRILLSHVLRNFKFISLDKQEDLKLCYSIITSPAKPLRMKILRRP